MSKPSDLYNIDLRSFGVLHTGGGHLKKDLPLKYIMLRCNSVMVSRIDKSLCKRLVTVLFFSVAFAYIEATVVVYLRALFYKQGFIFPLADFSTIEGFGPFLLTEIGREAATVVLILTASALIARDFRQRMAYFLIVFAVWDIFYYIWLKVLIGWPVSIMDWDLLFLMPAVWAGPVLAPVITSVTMLFISAILLGKRVLKVTRLRGIAFIITAILIAICFCVAGLGITKAGYRSYFSWPIFIILHVVIVILTLRCKQTKSVKEKIMSESEISMVELAQSSCVPCQGGVEPLKGSQIEPFLDQLTQGWQVIEEHHIEKEFKFKNFLQALDFTNKVGQLAESVGHHPDIYLAWGVVKLTVWTHKIGGLHESDFIFAAKVDQLS